MSVSDKDIKRVAEISGTQELSHHTKNKFDHTFKRFRYHFPSLNWWGNTPIEPTGSGLTFAESITWINMMLHHLKDWAGQMDAELDKLAKDLREIERIIIEELAEQLPDIIQEYDLFDLIVTGNNDMLTSIYSMDTAIDNDETLFSLAFRTENGFIEACKTKETTDVSNCKDSNSTWSIHVNERYGNNLLDYYLLIKNIPSVVNRVWIINNNDNKLESRKEIYYIFKNQIKRAFFDKNSTSELKFENLHTNYLPYWIVNCYKHVPHSQNYLNYMTLDYKVYQYDLKTGNEDLLYKIPLENQDIFDPIDDVIESKSSIWAVTYTGVTNRYLSEMNGLCFEPCFDGHEMYQEWETPAKIIFSEKKYQGIVPANMFKEFVNHNQEVTRNKMLSSLCVTNKDNDYKNTLNIYELKPKQMDNRLVSKRLDRFFTESVLNDLINRKALSDYQGYFSYDVTKNIENFIDAPLLLITDSKEAGDGAKFILENKKFIQDNKSKIRTFEQILKLINEKDDKRSNREFKRTVQQRITKAGIITNIVSRWHDSSFTTNKEKINTAVTGKKFDYLSLAGSSKIYNALEFENSFDDTPLKTYKYYKHSLDRNHPIFKDMDSKNVIVEVTKGSIYEKNNSNYEIVIKWTLQDDHSELQFRRVMRFDRSNYSGQVGGRNKAAYVGKWSYVYYTTNDDSAPKDYDKNPNQGIDKKVEDIIREINNRFEKLEERTKKLETRVKEMERGNDAINKIIEQLEKNGVWKDGNFVPGMGIAAGNINLFAGSQDGSHWIRTNNGKTENDLAAGIV